MQLAETASERALADEVRTFLTREDFRFEQLPHELDERMAVLKRWQAACYEAGFVGRAWPAEFGGGGRPPVEQIVVDQELAAAGAPEFVNVVGLDVLGPRCSASATTSSAGATSRRSCPPRRSGVRGSPSRKPGRISPACAPARCRTVTRSCISGQKTWVSWGQYATLVRGPGAHRGRRCHATGGSRC